MDAFIDQTGVLSQIFNEVEERFRTCYDLAHGWDHVQRVYTLALQLAEHEHADRFIVGLAALLHDLGRTVQHQEGEHHADLSITHARELLHAYQVPAEQQQAILHAIIAHSFSRRIEPLTLEACIVRDADRLDALGAIGIMRWAIVGAQRQAAHPYQASDPFCEQHVPDDYTYMLDHFQTKLLKLVDTMTTRTGQELARQRTSFMLDYLNAFRQELALTPNTP